MIDEIQSGTPVSHHLFESTFQILYWDSGYRVRYVNTDKEKVIRDDPVREEKVRQLLNLYDFESVR